MKLSKVQQYIIDFLQEDSRNRIVHIFFPTYDIFQLSGSTKTIKSSTVKALLNNNIVEEVVEERRWAGINKRFYKLVNSEKNNV